MDLDAKNIYTLLHEYAEDANTGPRECHQLLKNLNYTLTQEQLNLTYLDLHLQYMFKKTDGLLNFVTKILSKKPYESSVVTLLEIIYALINNFSFKLEKYVFTIHEISLKVIKSTLTTSNAKVKALDVLIISFEKINNKCVEDPEHYMAIYNTIYKGVVQGVKKSDSVYEKSFIALGSFGKHFQFLIENKSDELKSLFLIRIESEMCGKDYSNKMINGLFTGLNQFCESFPFDLNKKDDEIVINKLYKYIDKLAIIPESRIKIANRAVLSFFANNISLFAPLIMQKYEYWHDTLLKWLLLVSENAKTGFLVVQSFYHGLGEFLSKETDAKYQNAVSYFLDYFKKCLKDKETSSREKTLSLYGFFAFTTAYQNLLSDEEVKELFNLIIHSFEETFIVKQEYAEVLEYLPNYVQTIAKFVQARKITNSELFCLQKGVILIIKTFPQLPYSHYGIAVDALVFTFHFLATNDENTFNNFMENIVYQGVVWTCSHKHLSEAEILEEKIITVKDYLPLWKHLLKMVPIRKYDKDGIFLDDRKYILTKIIEKLIRTMFILINKLNVSISLADSNAPVTDIESAYRVAEANDFAIFLNVVDFYQEIFLLIEPSMLKKCIFKLIHHLLSKCIKNPLISGFYKLLSFCLKTCNSLNFFDEANITSVQDITICYHSLLKFIEILLNKTKQLKGDLLIACLQVLLEYPPLIIGKMLPACVPSFRIIFEVGKNYIKLTEMAINTLERWQQDIPNEEMEPFLAQIIPLLDFYLRSKSIGGLTQSVVEKRRKTTQALKKRQIVVEIEPELMNLQRKILNFIGKQSSSLCQAFVFSENNIELAVWGNQQHLKVTLPYQDIKLDIYMDKLLPRIIDLALNSTERRSRVVACELLQATMMVFLGVTKKMPHSAISDLNELLKNTAFPLLKLGCDMDQVVEQLFRPLFFQLIHWYTHATQISGEHSAIIIEAIMEGITHPTDSALRDFSGQCVNEFIKWTIKQSNERNLAHNPLNIKVLLKKMRFYSSHPDAFKKLGAALIFNNIYRDIREETALLSIFWMEFLHVFVKSLSLYVGGDDENCVGQINSALTHVERGFVEKSDLFNKSDRSRRVPTDFQGDTLKDSCVWILLQTGSQSPFCREKCMSLFCNITPYTEGFENLKAFISENVADGWVKENYESFLVKFPRLDSLRDCDDISPIKWLQGLLCAIDGYSFVIENDLIEDFSLSEEISTAIKYFMSKVAEIPLESALALIEAREWIFTEFEKQEFDKQKSCTVQKLYQFFGVVLSKNQSQMELFYGRDLWNLTLNVIFNKQTLGFDLLMEDNDKLTFLLENFMKQLPATKLADLTAILNDYVTKNLFVDVDFKSNIPLKHRNIIKGLIMLQSFNYNVEKFATGFVSALLNRFIAGAENGIIYEDELQHTTLNYCLSVFDFALGCKNEFQSFVEFLYKPYMVQTLESHQTIHFGIYILLLFEDSVMQKLVENFEDFLNQSDKFPINLTTELVVCVLHYLSLKKPLRKYKEEVALNILAKWNKFVIFFNQDIFTIEKGIELVKYVLLMIKSPQNESLNNWLVNILTYDQNLPWKQELDMKINVFVLLADLTEIGNEKNTDLKSNLMHFKNKFFSDVASIPLDIKQINLDKLLGVTPKLKAPTLLEFLLDIYVTISTENSHADVKSLLRDYMLTNSDTVQERTLYEVTKMCHRDDLDYYQKYKLMTNVAALFQYSTSAVFEDFMAKNMCEIIATLQKETDITNLLEKTLQFIILEVMFLRSPIKSTEEMSPITQAANYPSNKHLLGKLFKFTLDAFKDTTSQEWELFRRYKCHAYNAMVSIVSNSMDDVNFYTKLFIRQENNNDILWTNLVDTKKTYVFPTDFDSIPTRKKVLVSIRDEMRARRKLENKQSVKYIESLRVYNSSLSEDLTKFDFTNYYVRSQLENEPEENTSFIQSEIELDCTDVNTHECMATVCGLIQHLVNKNIIELPDKEDDDYVLPQCIKGIINLLLSEDTHANVKIFWVKVIDNVMHVFKHFAKWLLEPLLKFLVDKCAGNSLNYFITDVVAILASWSNEAVPTKAPETSLASELLSFLINNLNNERTDMFKYHLELLRVLIEAWKTSVQIPHDIIFSKLQVDPTSGKIEVGIHLISILLANNVAPWENSSVQDYCKILFSVVMKNHRATIYKSCAETIGLILRFTSGQPYFAKIFNNALVLLRKIDNLDKYARVLEAVVLRYPPIADESHLNRLLSRIHEVTVDLKQIYLRILLTRSDVLSTVRAFKDEKWESYIENDALGVQILSLELVHKCLDILKSCDNFRLIIQSMSKHVSHPNVLCRSRVFDVAISVCQTSNMDREILDLCKDILIQGLTDNEEEIHDKVFNFWQTSASLPLQVSERFSYVISNLYKTTTENEFLGYGTYLLLDVIKNTEAYNEILFEHPLEDCDFEEYHLETNWRVRHLSVVPLFAETLQTLSEGYSLDSSNLNKLRQTMTSLEFKPTQSVRAKELTQFTMSESSLFIKNDQDGDFLDPNLVQMSYKYRVPKRRFLRDKSKIIKYFAHQQVEKSVQKVEMRKDRAKERENKVTIYRSYRKGDLPDIQIALQAILQPLQVLTLHDSEVAKILYLEIYKSIFNKMKGDQAFMEQISSGIESVFTKSVHFNRNVFRALLDTLLLSKSCIIIQPDLISSVSRSAGLTTLGILLLEEYLISYDDCSSDSKKSRGQLSGGEINYWVKLAELYKEMDEWDVVKSIFLEKMDCKEMVNEAIMAESRKQWKEAQNLYERLIQTDETHERRDFYYESYFKCFAYLGEWDKLIKSVDKFVDNSWNNLWDQDWNQQKLLPWYINGQLKNALFMKVAPNQFFTDLSEALNSDKLDYLQNNFAEELAMLWIFKNEADEAEVYLKTYVDNFLSNWYLLDPLSTNLRYNKILKLRNVVDINNFINVYRDLNTDSKTELINLINYWNRTTKENLSSILLSEERVLYRKQFITLLETKIIQQEDEDFHDLISELKQVRFRLHESFMNMAIEENNFYLTRKYLQTYDNDTKLRLKLPMSKLAVIRSKMVETKKLEILLEACRIISPVFETEDSQLRISAYLQLFLNLDQIIPLLEDEELFNTKNQEIANIIERDSISSVGDVSLYGLTKLKSVLLTYETEQNNQMDSEAQNCAIVASAYEQLAYFAKKQGELHHSDFMFFVLKAMQFGSSEGRQLFPCILMKPEFNDADKMLFIEEVEKIPVWMFLGWIPQLLVNVDSSKVSAVKPIVIKIAKTYPQAIMYAYRLSKENYTFKNNPYAEETKSLIKKLDELLLHEDRIDTFLKALSFVGVPAAILLYYVKKLIKACQLNDEEDFKTIQETILTEVFSEKPDSRFVNSLQGNMFKKIEKYKQEINNIKKSKDARIKTLQKINRELGDMLQSPAENKKNSRLLKDYSPWLANFSANKLNLDLEIPGQYDGKRRPLTQHHTKISGFCPNVSIMSSLRKPIKITILGNDTKEYSFLVKFGEDIRQDQRVQQLFSLMNNIFENDKELNKRSFSILTYQVIPLTTSLGIIQWVDDTTSLQEFIEKPLKSKNTFNQLYETYKKWVYKSSMNKPIGDVYGSAAVNNSRDKTIPKFLALVNSIQWDVLKLSFLSLSANSESFAALRNNFIQSYAVMCIGQWILGVGDRHLSNSLICIKNGKVLGIDFGHAFGTATQILPVPELVPFRLTPHIVSLMEPLGEKGLFKETMIHCLRSLRLNSGTLLATMNVFIEEPSLDWLEQASRFDDSSSGHDWYPSRKIDQARRKLEGANSTTIMCEDLMAGHQRNQKFLKAYLEMVKGLPEFNVRARKEGDFLSVEDQVDCLIDHATDYNLLGRMWEGWYPWV